jgi:hypothetical protein
VIPDRGLIPLAARAWVGDGSTGALAGADGTIDWWCPGRADAAPVFSRLLSERGGALRVAIAGGPSDRRVHLGSQHYITGSNVAVTVLRGAESTIEIVDAMSWPGPSERPPGRLIRLITATRGPAEVDIEVAPGGPWGPAAKVSSWSDGLVFDGTVVRTGIPMLPVGAGRDARTGRQVALWRGTIRLDTGESLVVTAERLGGDPLPALAVDAAHRALDDTVAAWRSWLAPATLEGPYAERAARGLLAVRSLVPYATGAPFVAATTSLPRRIGGERQWDGRLARLGTVAAAAVTWRRVGLVEDAEAAEGWLRAALADTGGAGPWPAPLLDIDGNPASEAEELGLSGWRNSQPVISGAPAGRIDLDAAADLFRAVRAAPVPTPSPSEGGGIPTPLPRAAGPLTAAWPALVNAADWLADNWATPDHGVWLGGAGWGEPPAPVQLVSSRLRVGAALERAAALARAANPFDLDALGWHQASRQILDWVQRHGVADAGGLRRGPSPTDGADAALLRVAWEGPWPAGHPLVVTTVERVLERLSAGPFCYRQPPEVDDGAGGPDSPDLLASLWAVRALVARGRWEEAHERMEALVELSGPLGLLSAAGDPLAGELLGNFPDTAVHLAFVDAAIDLAAGPG